MPSLSQSIREKGFKCPSCAVIAQHNWSTCYVNWSPQFKNNYQPLKNPARNPQDRCFTGLIECAECQVCNKISLWIGERMIFPLKPINVPDPNIDMPESVKSIYLEAASIYDLSPCASAALLRLCVEKLLDELDIAKGKKLFKRIGEAKLPPQIQQSADIIRIFGNDKIHSGEIQLEEDKSDLIKLFLLLNLMTQRLITEPKMVRELNRKIPVNKQEEIKERDNN